HAPYPLVIPRPAVQAQPIKALPKSPAAVLLHDRIEGLDDLGISHHDVLRLSVVRRPRQAYCGTGLFDRHAVLLNHEPRRLPLRRRRHHFLDSTSLIAVFSRASSAYKRLSLAFSASSSRMRVSSDTVTPEYLLFQAYQVAALMPCLRHTSATGTPASPSFRIATIWLSLNLLFFIATSSSLRPHSRVADVYRWWKLTTAARSPRRSTTASTPGGR